MQKTSVQNALQLAVRIAAAREGRAWVDMVSPSISACGSRPCPHRYEMQAKGGKAASLSMSSGVESVHCLPSKGNVAWVQGSLASISKRNSIVL